ncbi:MAG: hypothetical protein FWH18_00200 [Marinilabiliaceae bacterium]|nr:hypothetical protein [Marinilabiliaceae bacterium]
MPHISGYCCFCDPCGCKITILYGIVGARLALALFLGNRKGCPYNLYPISFKATARVAHTDTVKRYYIFDLL